MTKNGDCSCSSSWVSHYCLLPACLRCDPPRSISFLEQFSYKQLKKATDCFCRIIIANNHTDSSSSSSSSSNNNNNQLGITYEARFIDGSVALVKEIKGTQEHMDVFYKEVQFLARLHHRHLVALRGYSVGGRRRSLSDMELSASIQFIVITCGSKSTKLICLLLLLFAGFRFMVFESTGYISLKEHLNDPLKTPLTWKTRQQIAIGVAAALHYLLYFCDPPIYQVSISSNHIMLDERFAAKVTLADVGLLSSSGYSVEIPLPSCSKECLVQEPQNLIPRFGALILELITGQSSEEDNADVVQWIQDSRFAMSMDKMIDPDLGNSYDLKAVRSLLAVARLCMKAGDKPAFSMSHIFWYLQETVGNLGG